MITRVDTGNLKVPTRAQDATLLAVDRRGARAVGGLNNEVSKVGRKQRRRAPRRGRETQPPSRTCQVLVHREDHPPA